MRAVRKWLDATKIDGGPLFRPVAKGGKVMSGRVSDKQVVRTIKAFAARLGLDAAAFGSHSLRAGFLTSAARAARVYPAGPRISHEASSSASGLLSNGRAGRSACHTPSWINVLKVMTPCAVCPSGSRR